MSDERTCERCHGSGDIKAMTQEHGPDDYEFEVTCPDCGGTGVKPLTIFLCGPKKCEHDYQGGEDVIENGENRGWTAVCVKCGARAIDEAAWL